MTVESIAPALVEVEHNSEDRTVDLEGGACDCADSLYRPETYCKHAIQVAIVTMFTEGITTSFVRYISEHPCPADYDRICDGLTGPRFPCPECVEATTAGDWAVWQLTEGRTGARR